MTGFTGAFPTHLKALKVTTTEAGGARAAPLGGVPKVCPSSASLPLSNSNKSRHAQNATKFTNFTINKEKPPLKQIS